MTFFYIHTRTPPFVPQVARTCKIFSPLYKLKFLFVLTFSPDVIRLPRYLRNISHKNSRNTTPLYISVLIQLIACAIITLVHTSRRFRNLKVSGSNPDVVTITVNLFFCIVFPLFSVFVFYFHECQLIHANVFLMADIGIMILSAISWISYLVR